PPGEECPDPAAQDRGGDGLEPGGLDLAGGGRGVHPGLATGAVDGATEPAREPLVSGASGRSRARARGYLPAVPRGATRAVARPGSAERAGTGGSEGDAPRGGGPDAATGARGGHVAGGAAAR